MRPGSPDPGRVRGVFLNMEKLIGNESKYHLLKIANNRNLLIFAIGLRFTATIFKNLPEDVIPLMVFGYEALSFITICSLIVLNRDCLENYHIDRPALILFMLGGSIFRTTLPGLPTVLEVFVFWGTTIWLFIKLRKMSVEYRKPYKSWWVYGIATGILGGLLILILYSKNVRIEININNFLEPVLVGLFISFSHAAIIEEPIFRGFLWGFLKNRGWKGQYILVFQALLFWLVHINYISKPFTFWITVPLSGLVLGGLAWKTKSIAPAILAHTIYNTFVYLMQNGVI